MSAGQAVCLDSSVLVKLLVHERGSEAAARLMEKILEEKWVVYLPSFAWAEVGSVLRQKVLRNEVRPEEAEEAWGEFRRLGVIKWLDGQDVPDLAWRIAVEENLPTIYDAAYLAVAEKAQAREFWTADEKLARTLAGRKAYVRLLSEM